MYDTPPSNLAEPGMLAEMSDGELFWIVSNGIRTTGMPAFGPTHKPDDIWKIVSLIRHLPELSAQEQKAPVVEHRHLQQHPAHALRRGGGDLERDVRAEPSVTVATMMPNDSAKSLLARLYDEARRAAS